MKNLCIQIWIAVMVVAQAGAQLVADDYETDIVGAMPAGPSLVRPTTIANDIKTVVVGSGDNLAGSGSALRILDDSGSLGVQCLYDLSTDAIGQMSTVRIDFSFAPLSTLGNGGAFLIALGEYGSSMTSYRDRFLNCLLRDDGSIGFTSGDGAYSTNLVLLSSSNTLSIFVNDLANGILYTGPDESTHILGPDSVAYWLNGDLIVFGGVGYAGLADRDTAAGSVSTSTNNIGRFGFVSITSARSPDYVIDDLVIDELPDFPIYNGGNRLVYEGENGLTYAGYSNEGENNPVNTVPDFSNAGYGGGGVPIPFIPTDVVVSNSNGSADDTAMIQAAINSVSALPPGSNGFRGAVLIKAGDYTVSNTLNIAASGVVIRGEGSQAGGTKITYTKTEQSNLFEVDNSGSNPSEVYGTSQAITDAYVPVGTKSFRVADASGYAVGDPIRIEYLMNAAWITDLGMDNIYDPIDKVDESWSASSYQLKFYRTITAVNGDLVTIDAPIVQAIEARYGGAEIYKYSFAGQLENIGFEGLQLVSSFASNVDENHGWNAIAIRRLKNGWIRQVTARYFGYGLANILSNCSQITVQDCAMLDPKSQTIGGRKYSFNIDDSDRILVQRCLTRGGRHDFASGSQTPGPNVFSDCRANTTYADIGPHHRYATGQLYDNIMGGQMNVQNRMWSGTGHGWAGAQIMFWNCDASSMISEAPAGAMNWCVGSKGVRNNGNYVNEPDGIWVSHNTHVLPRSLYHAQLQERLGAEALQNILLPVQTEGDIWDDLDVWGGEGLFADEVIAWVDAPVIEAAQTVSLKGICRNLQMLEKGVSYIWEQISGPGTVVFDDASLPETSATVSGPSGNYMIQLVVNDGTTTASSTVAFAIAGVPQIQNAGAVPVGLNSMELRGQLFSVIPAGIEVVWDVTDQGANLMAWTGRQTLAGQNPGVFGAVATGLQPGSNYVYRCMASNEFGVTWSDASLFALHPHSYVRLEDFEPYSPGVSIGGQGAWGGTADSQEFTVWADPDNPENQVLKSEQGVNDAVYLNHEDLRINNGTTGTLFFRIRAFCEVPGDPANPANELWLRASLSDVAAATEFADGETDTEIDDSGGGNLSLFTTAAGTWEQLKWHRVWFVVDNASDVFDVYVQPEGGSQVKVINDKPFRNGAATSDIVSFMLRFRYNSGKASYGDAWFDDIYVSHGADMHTYSPVGSDQDMDGLDDIWELGEFASYTASAGGANDDYDDDGFIDLYEYLAGTDAADAGSLLKVTSGQAGPAANDFVLSWQAVAGKNYTIRETTNLVDGAWNPVATGIPGIEPLNTYTVQLQNAETFYRVELEQ